MTEAGTWVQTIVDIESLPESEMIVNGLHERTCDNIINKSSVLTDPVLTDYEPKLIRAEPILVNGELIDGEDTVDDQPVPIKYSHDLLHTTREDDPRNICLPPFVKKLLKREVKLFEYDWLSEVFRRHVLHGLARHDHTHGDKLRDLLDNDVIGLATDTKDTKILYAIGDGVKCDFLTKRCTTVRFNKEFWNLIEEAREDAGVDDREKWLVYIVALSMKDHSRFTSWQPDFDKIIDVVQQQLDTRIEKLEKIIREKNALEKNIRKKVIRR